MSERILLTRLRYIGDVVLTTPCIRVLRDSFPKAEITYLTQAPYGEILENNPFLTRVLSIDFASLGTVGAMRLLWQLRRSSYDLAVDLFSNPRSALLTASTGARKRVGTYHFWRSWAYNVNVRVPPAVRSAVEHHLEHLRSVGLEASFSPPEVFVTKEETEEGDRLMRASGIAEPSKTILLQPGAKWHAKRWPVKRFGELAELLRREAFPVAFVAGPGEETNVIESKVRVPDAPVVSGLTLRQLVKVLSAAAAYVGNDGGPAHLAAGLKKPMVAVFGPSEPDIWFPYPGDGRSSCVWEEVECRPCHLHFCEHVNCLQSVSARRVFWRLMELLEVGGPARE
ncbi:MAG: glycosyltransferase family 9 protein [Candidatus Eiseniibacteriota bacterium]|nr:MAG: glycosyltransferase family 9 protein [Candidatus Eisenbacteria bacterium]